MPLQQVYGPHYVKRARVFIDPDDRDTRSKDQFDFVAPLDNLYEHVTAIELVNYNIRGTLQKTFVEEENKFPGNNVVDIHLEDVATGLEVLDFAVTINPAGYTTADDMAAALTLQFNAQMDAQAHLFFNSSNSVFWTITENTSVNGNNVDQALDFKIEENHTAGTVQANFLFSSGANKRNNASLPLGFDEVDTSVFTVGATTYYTPQPEYRPEFFVFRYMDINIKEFNEFKPLARIFLTNENLYTKCETTVSGTRILTEPVKHLQEMRIKITLKGGRKPPIEICSGVDLTFDLLQISRETQVPSWTQQLFKY
jgi:hypothetical protein